MSTISFVWKPSVSKRHAFLHNKFSYVTVDPMLEKLSFGQQFATRLRDALLNAGHQSARSTSGVNIHALSLLTGHSPQICRKYLRGQALPEPLKLIDIANKLNVSPGWLLFGEETSPSCNRGNLLQISKPLLHYILMDARSLYTASFTKEEIADFLVDLVCDLSQIHASDEQSKRIIDLALSSTRHFST